MPENSNLQWSYFKGGLHFHTKSAKTQAKEDKQLLEHFHDESPATKIDALIAILNENGLVTEAELLDKINEVKGLK